MTANLALWAWMKSFKVTRTFRLHNKGMLAEEKGLASWWWSQRMNSVLQDTAFGKLPSRAVLLSSQMMAAKPEVTIWSEVLPCKGYFFIDYFQEAKTSSTEDN